MQGGLDKAPLILGGEKPRPGPGKFRKIEEREK